MKCLFFRIPMVHDSCRSFWINQCISFIFFLYMFSYLKNPDIVSTDLATSRKTSLFFPLMSLRSQVPLSGPALLILLRSAHAAEDRLGASDSTDVRHSTAVRCCCQHVLLSGRLNQPLRRTFAGGWHGRRRRHRFALVRKAELK